MTLYKQLEAFCIGGEKILTFSDYVMWKTIFFGPWIGEMDGNISLAGDNMFQRTNSRKI